LAVRNLPLSVPQIGHSWKLSFSTTWPQPGQT